MGIKDEFDDIKTIGKLGSNIRHARGERLIRWSQTNQFRIANTMFEKPFRKIFTHTTATGRKRRIDFALVQESIWKFVQDAESLQCIGAKSDRNGVRIKLEIQEPRKSNNKPRERHINCSWNSVDEPFLQR